MREKCQTILSQLDNNIIRDSTSISWKNFEWNNGYYIHKISKLEIERPYLISWTYYESIEYWDIILLLNNIEDVFEIVPLSEIYIPKLSDLKTFIANNLK
jgi:poly-D-alanine transfer protein DltD